MTLAGPSNRRIWFKYKYTNHLWQVCYSRAIMRRAGDGAGSAAGAVGSGRRGQAAAHQPQDWRSLQDTPAGRLLTALYGTSTPLINYPVPSSKRSSGPAQASHTKPFIPGGGKADVDVRSGSRKDVNIQVPRFGKPRLRSPPARVCMLPRRKSAAAIEQEVQEISFQRTHYRPPVTHPVSTEREKSRLNELFIHKGGKALPDELLHPVGPTPTELAEARKREKELRQKRIKAGLEQPPMPAKQPDLFDMVVGEIEERANHLSAMAEECAGRPRAELVARTRAEIADRMRELQRIDSQRYQAMQESMALDEEGVY